VAGVALCGVQLGGICYGLNCLAVSVVGMCEASAGGCLALKFAVIFCFLAG